MQHSFLDLLANLPTSSDLQPPLPPPADPLPPPQRGRAPFLDDLEYPQRHGNLMNMGTHLGDDDDEEDDHYYASFRGGHFTADLKMCTEILGSESGDFTVSFSLWTAMAAATDDDDDDRSRIISSSSSNSTLVLRTSLSMLKKERMMRVHLMKDLPPMLPLLSTLNRYGRPRFMHKKETMSEGRLLISIDKDRRPRAVWKTASTSASGDYNGVSKKETVSDGWLLISIHKDRRPRAVWKTASTSTSGDYNGVVSKKETVSDGWLLISVDKDRLPRAVWKTASTSTSGDYNGVVSKKLLVLSYNSDDDRSDDQEDDVDQMEEEDQED